MPTERRPQGCTARLANRGTKPRTGRMERFLKSQGVSVAQYQSWTGGQPLNAFAKANPSWTQRTWEVLVLENRALLQTPPQLPLIR